MSAYTPFQEQIAVAWAQAALIKFDAAYPDATGSERVQMFSEALEGGLGIALKFTNGY